MSKPDKLILIVTRKCNLRCRYCPVSKSGSSISPAVFERAIDLFSAAGGKEIKFFGGEPLLEFPSIRSAADYALKKDGGIKFEIASNGYLLNKEIEDWLLDRKIGLTVSFDLEGKNFHGRIKISPDLKNLLRKMVPGKLAAALVVTPGKTPLLFENFHVLARAGFKSINLLPTFYTLSWQEEELAALKKELAAVSALARSLGIDLPGFGKEKAERDPLYNLAWAVDCNGDLYGSDFFLLTDFWRRKPRSWAMS